MLLLSSIHSDYMVIISCTINDRSMLKMIHFGLSASVHKMHVSSHGTWTKQLAVIISEEQSPKKESLREFGNSSGFRRSTVRSEGCVKRQVFSQKKTINLTSHENRTSEIAG